MISDKEDTAVITLFLEAVKSRSPSAEVRVLMTDDGENNVYFSLYSLHSNCIELTRSTWHHVSRLSTHRVACFTEGPAFIFHLIPQN